MEKTKTDLLREVRDGIVNFTDSPLYEYRKANNYFPVIGEGNHKAKIMFIGEAPGKKRSAYRPALLRSGWKVFRRAFRVG